ncbi:MAG: serine/threonine-protein kinase [Pseudomonadota bacterium]
MDISLPERFNLASGLTLGKRLGKGGFGITYTAEMGEPPKKYAVKEYFPSEFATRGPNYRVVPNPEDRDLFDLGMNAFLNEANILKTLPRQPGLVRVRGAFEKFNTAYCLMEYIEGDPVDRMLPRIVKHHGHVPEALIEDFVRSITAALAAVHHKRLIHRDVKPANVMIRRNGQPVLIDFGAARPYGKRTNDPAMFTRKYAPIELFPTDQQPPGSKLREGPWSDLYSLSVMLYEMVSRRAPPDAKSRLKSYLEKGHDTYMPVAEAISASGGHAGYSKRLFEMIDYGCALLPEDRPADALAYCRIFTDTEGPSTNDLKNHAEFGRAEKWTDAITSRLTGFGEGVQTGFSGPDPSLTPEQHDEHMRKRGVAKMLGIVFLLAAATAFLGWMGQQG